jgi:hypothetical protein
MVKCPSSKTIMEPAQEIKVFTEADVVVGGGPGGVASAIEIKAGVRLAE